MNSPKTPLRHQRAKKVARELIRRSANMWSAHRNFGNRPINFYYLVQSNLPNKHLSRRFFLTEWMKYTNKLNKGPKKNYMRNAYIHYAEHNLGFNLR